MATPPAPGSHAARIAQQRAASQGVSLAGDAEKPLLRLVEPGEGADETEEGRDDGKEYRAYMTAKVPPRLRFKPGWRQHNKSIQWYPTPEIEDDLDRETANVPQVILVKTPGSVTRIEGFHLDRLASNLNRQVVVEIRAYCPRRWPGKAFAANEARVTRILYQVIDGRTTVGKKVRAGMAIVPQEHVEGLPESSEHDLTGCGKTSVQIG